MIANKIMETRPWWDQLVEVGAPLLDDLRSTVAFGDDSGAAGALVEIQQVDYRHRIDGDALSLDACFLLP